MLRKRIFTCFLQLPSQNAIIMSAEIERGSSMKEYEIVAKFYNAGASLPETFFEERELESPEDFVRMKHGRDFDKFTREETAEGQILFRYDNGSLFPLSERISV